MDSRGAGGGRRPSSGYGAAAGVGGVGGVAGRVPSRAGGPGRGGTALLPQNFRFFLCFF